MSTIVTRIMKGERSKNLGSQSPRRLPGLGELVKRVMGRLTPRHKGK